mgnify:FL=1
MLEIVDKIPVILNALPYILQGGVVTLITVIGSLALGFCIGLPLAVLQVYGPSFIRRIIGVYVWFFRGMPILLLLFLFYFGLFEVIGLNLSTITASCLVLGMASAAYQSQIFRGSIETLPVGQFRAARALGARPRDVFFKVILPGAMPFIFTGLQISMGYAWFSLVAGEMLAGEYGLGYLIWNSFMLVQYPVIIIAMITLGVIGSLSSLLIRMIGNRLMQWKVREEVR